MPAEKIYSRSWRLRKAYGTAAVVMLGYARLWLLKKLLGRAWYERRIAALHLRNAERVKNAILELKGLFIKLGQMLSILGNFLPEAFQKPLEALQDRIPPRPYSEVRERVIGELGKPPEELFASFEETPVASASIGQVHRATLPDGTEVAVKVQHVNIEHIAEVDLHIIRRLTALISWFFDIKGMDHMYTQVRQMIEEELDFAREATSMERIAENLAEEPHIAVPAVHRDYSTTRVLTTTWHTGAKVSNTAQLDEWGLERREIAARLLRAYCRMVFKDGFYHADPHPGNILIEPDGRVVLLDFGAVAALSQGLREGIPQLIEAAVKNDTPAMIQACRKMGFIAEGREAEKMAAKMIAAMRNFIQNEVEFEGLNFKDIKVNPFNNSLFGLIREIGFRGISSTVQVPKEYVLLNRMITLLLGICSALDARMNPLDVVRPYVQEFAGSEREDMLRFAANLLRRTLATAIGLPDELHRALQQLQRGETEFRSPDIRDSAKVLHYVARQLVLTILGIAAGVVAWLFYRSGAVMPARIATGASALFFWLLFAAMRKAGRVVKGME
ncbi:MAG: AarF/ABC1/UbiB kinase family protein [Saprospiraceae bacterium]|nr:AarF/ABC1/UbiB kinase family protein [Saprospiraceae bacterium]